MLGSDDGKKAVKLARSVIEHHVNNKAFSHAASTGVFQENHGVFVTLHTYAEHELRGCIGIPEPVMTLENALVEAAKSVTRDPRFPPLEHRELSSIIVEVTVLTKPERLTVENPQEYMSAIEIGRDGLIVEQGFFKGLLLPQVPVEQGWDKETFLAHTCMKAGLLPDAWYEKQTKIYTFSGQIFSELKPDGTIKEKQLNGSEC